MVSDNFYERGIHKKFRGLNKENPLEKLNDMIDIYGKLEFTFDEVLSYLKIPKESLYTLLIEISKIGYLSVDMKGNKVIFFKKFLNLEKFKRKVLDSDDIIATRGNIPAILKVDIYNGNMKSINLKNININSNQNVVIFPYKGKVDIGFDRNINMKEGSYSVGGYNFWGDSTEFDYNEYKINIIGNQTASINIPEIKSKSISNRKMKEVINRLSNVRGEILINDILNKSSGKDSISIKYPKFITTQKSFIYYDMPKILKGHYDRKRFYVEIPPFKKDSLIKNTSHKRLFFDAIVNTEIMPSFKEKIRIQKDYSLGFIRKTPEEGFPIYGERGNFRNLIILSSKGLKGIGTLKYSVSVSESENILFYLDSLKAKTTKFNIKKTIGEEMDVPNVSHDFVDINWDVKADTMTLKSKTPFNLYNKLVKNTGKLKLTRNSLTGAGKSSLRNGTVTSKKFNYNSKSFFSNKLDFALRENSKSPNEFFIDNAYGKIDIENESGEFKLNDAKASIEIVPVKFKAYVRNVFWDMKSSSVIMKADNDSLGKFKAISPKAKGLEFEAGKAIYNLRTKTLNTENVEDIKISDVIITPDEGKVVIKRGGKIKKMKNSFMQVLDGDDVIHEFKNSNVNINSGREYKGSGKYIYKDRDNKESNINFSNIYADTTSMFISKGEGYIKKEEKFKISSEFDFYGNVFMEKRNKDLRFQGFIDLNNLCDKKNIKTGKRITINSSVNNKSPVLEIGSPEKDKAAETIYSGILSPKGSELEFNSVFMYNDSIKQEDIYILNKVDKIKYNYKKNCYETLSKEGYKSYFYDKECKLEIEGELKFNNMGLALEIEGFANAEQNLKTKKVSFNNLTYAINFEFEEDIFDGILEQFEYKDTVLKLDTTFKKNVIFDTIVEKIEEKVKKAIPIKK